MARGFRRMSQIEDHIKKTVEKSLTDKLPNVVKNVMQSNILREVYLSYTPKVYQRRGNDDGLMADENIVYEKTSRNRVEFMNVAERNTQYADTQYTDMYLTPLIEFGHKKAIQSGYQGYNYPRGGKAYMYERPFIQATREELFLSKVHVDAVKDVLQSKGFRVRDK